MTVNTPPSDVLLDAAAFGTAPKRPRKPRKSKAKPVPMIEGRVVDPNELPPLDGSSTALALIDEGAVTGPVPIAYGDGDDILMLPPMMEAELAIPIDIAADEACVTLGLPLLGGPSGRGWSYYGTAQQCPYLFQQTYELQDSDGHERTKPAIELQVGGLFHLLLALYYGYGLNGDGEIFYHERGMLAPSMVANLGKRGRKGKNERMRLPCDAADQVLAYLKGAAKHRPSSDGSIIPEARPSEAIILEAERLFDAHTNYYGAGNEDFEPLACEWFAAHPILGYTCRYDMIVRVGPHDPFVRLGLLEPGAIVIVEHKSSKWLSEMAREGWFIDGEILGQLLLWKPSGAERIFGPLAGLLVDITTKEKLPKHERILVHPNPITTRAHERGVKYQNAEIALWRATDFYPKRWISCWRFGRKCGLYETCRAATAVEAAEGHDGE